MFCAIIKYVYNENKKICWQQVPRAVIPNISITSLRALKLKNVNCLILNVQTQDTFEEEAFWDLTAPMSKNSDQETIEDRKGRKGEEGSYWFPREERTCELKSQNMQRKAKKRAFSFLKGSLPKSYCGRSLSLQQDHWVLFVLVLDPEAS